MGAILSVISKIVITLFGLIIAGMLGYMGYRYNEYGVVSPNAEPTEPDKRVAYSLWSISALIVFIIGIYILVPIFVGS